MSKSEVQRTVEQQAMSGSFPTPKRSEQTIAHYMGWAIVRRKNSPSLWIYGWHNGRRYRESAASPLLQAARRLIKKRVAQFAVDGKLPTREAEHATFADVAKRFVERVAATGRSSTHAAAVYRFKHLSKAFAGMRVVDLNHEAIDRYMVARLKAGAADPTVRQELTLLRAALRVAVRDKKLDAVPEFPKLPGDRSRQSYAEPEEIAALIDKLPKHVAPVAVLLARTGMRRGEALELEWSRVNVERREITLRAVDTKTGEPRVVTFDRVVAEMLKDQRARVSALERDGRCIINSVFPDVSLSTLLRHWRKAAKAIGRPELTRHDLRRSFARIAIDSGISESVAAKLGGWIDRRMLDRYNVRSRKDQADGSARIEAYLAKRANRRTATQDATLGKTGA